MFFSVFSEESSEIFRNKLDVRGIPLTFLKYPETGQRMPTNRSKHFFACHIFRCAIAVWAAALLVTAPAGRLLAEPAFLSYPYINKDESRFPSYRQLAERVAASYVKVTLTTKPEGWNEKPGELHTGSGIVLSSEGLLLTAAHIARGRNFEARVQLRSGKTYVGRIVAVSPKRELALIRTRSLPGTVPVRFGRSGSLKPKAWLLAIGSPKRRWGVVTLGTVRLPNIGERLDYGSWGFANAVEARMEVESGHSGGPVFDQAGRLVGMVAGYELGDTTKTPYVSPRITYIVPADDIAKWLEGRGIRIYRTP